MNCCNNLNRQLATINERLTEDVVTTVNVSSSSTTILNANANRRIVKIYALSLSLPSAEIWIRYGSGATLVNSAHPLPLRNLLIVDSAQAANAISAICTAGSASVRVSSAEKV
ncbi:MAG: hypothetical protein ACBR12_26065 [Microcoleus sp.]